MLLIFIAASSLFTRYYPIWRRENYVSLLNAFYIDQRFPVKINRITGDAKILTINGWQDADDYDHALDLFAEYKQQVIDAMEGQSESIRNNVMNSVLNELQHAKDEIVNAAPSETTQPTYADGTSVFYSANYGANAK